MPRKGRQANTDPSKIRHNRIWKPEEDSGLAVLVGQGLAPEQIAAMMNRSYRAITSRISIRGLNVNGHSASLKVPVPVPPPVIQGQAPDLFSLEQAKHDVAAFLAPGDGSEVIEEKPKPREAIHLIMRMLIREMTTPPYGHVVEAFTVLADAESRLAEFREDSIDQQSDWAFVLTTIPLDASREAAYEVKFNMNDKTWHTRPIPEMPDGKYVETVLPTISASTWHWKVIYAPNKAQAISKCKKQAASIFQGER